MNLEEFESIQPFVRMVKIKKSTELQGVWTDIDNLLIYTAAGESDYLLNGMRYHSSPGGFIPHSALCFPHALAFLGLDAGSVYRAL